MTFLYYVIIAIVAIAVLYGLLFLSRKRSTQGVYPREDFSSFLYSLREVKKRGGGVGVYGIAASIRRGNRAIRHKLAKGYTLLPFERWVYENSYLAISGLTSNGFRVFSALPHYKYVPRIVVLARRYLVDNSYAVNEGELAAFFAKVNAITPLTVGELNAFKEALRFALLEYFAYYAEKCVHYYRSEKLAHGKFDPRYAESDSYLYYYYTSHPEEEGYRIGERTKEGAALRFIRNISENEKNISHITTAIRTLPEVLTYPLRHSYLKERLQTVPEFDTSDKDSKEYALARIGYISRATSKKEEEIVDKAIAYTEEGESLFAVLELEAYAFLRFGRKKAGGGRRREVFYITSIILLSFFVSAILLYFDSSVIAIVAAVLLLFTYPNVIENILRRFAGTPNKRVAASHHQDIERGSKTAVIVSEFIPNENEARRAVKHILTLSSIPQRNVNYILLVDFKKSGDMWNKQDDTLLELMKDELDKSGKGNVYLACRHRVKKGDAYVAYERKRGAILDLFAYFVEGKNSFRFLGDDARDYQYAILLDGDSYLLPQGVTKAVNAISHKRNAGYDILAFDSVTNLYSVNNFFSKRYLAQGGLRVYDEYNDFYCAEFGKGVFSGKGVVRIETFYNKLKDAFPDNRILSHDIIEGATLSTSKCGIPVLEDVPDSYYSQSVRDNRWYRGDLRLLAYLAPRRRTKDGSKVPNDISPIYKWLIFANVMSKLRYSFLFVVLCLAAIYGSVPILCFGLISLCTLPVLGFFGEIRSVGVKRLRYVLRDMLFDLFLLVEEIFLLPYYAVNYFYIFFEECINALGKYKTEMVWTPFAMTKEKGLAHHMSNYNLAMILSTLVVVVSFNMFLAIYKFLFVVYVELSYLFTVKSREKSKGGLKEKAFFEEQAARLFAYLEEGTRSSVLIPDNIAYEPRLKTSPMTSPTDMAFGLLAIVLGVERKLMAVEDGEKRLVRLLSELASLATSSGNFYNWYSVETKSPLPPYFVSSVDNANLGFALLAVAAAFENSISVRDLAMAIYKSLDFSRFYIEEKGLLAIGHDVNGKLQGSYDMLASEARLIYYLHIAKGGKVSDYARLERSVVSAKGNTLLSWSGTAFEYLLPTLFLNAPRYSLLARSEGNARKVFLRSRIDKIFGQSECGIYSFNDKREYCYKAVGVRQLAADNDSCYPVVAPYASFLTLPYKPKQVKRNLARLQDKGCYGDYGFYEALDFGSKTDSVKVVKSYMAHHTGMSFAAIVNYLSDGYLRQLLEKDAAIRYVKLLLSERNIELMPVAFEKTCARIPPKPPLQAVYTKPVFPQKTVYLGNGEYSVFLDGLGRNIRSFQGVAMARQDRKEEFFGSVIKLSLDGGRSSFSPTFLPSGVACDDYSFYADLAKAEYRNDTSRVKLTVSVLDNTPADVTTVTFRNDTDIDKKLSICYYSDIVLNSLDAYLSHPQYSDMFVNISYEDGILLASRREASGETRLYVGVKVIGLDDITANGNRYNVIGRGRNLHTAELYSGIKASYAPPFGDVLYPCFCLSGERLAMANSDTVVSFITAFGNTKAEVVERLRGVEDMLSRDLSEYITGNGYTSSSLAYLVGHSATHILNEMADIMAKGLYPIERLKYLSKNRAEILPLLPSSRLTVALRYSGARDIPSLRILCHTAMLFDNTPLAFQPVIVADNGRKEEARSLASTIMAVPIFDGKEGELILRCAFYIIGEKREEMSAGYVPLTENGRAERLLKLPSYALEAGEGGFTEEGCYEVRAFDYATLLPYSNVIADTKGGTIVTENGGGFSYRKNSREGRLTKWYGDPVSDTPSEKLYIAVDGKLRRINTGMGKGCFTSYDKGVATYFNGVEDIASEVTEYLIEEGEFKVFEVRLKNNSVDVKKVRLAFLLVPCLGAFPSFFSYAEPCFEGKLRVENAYNGVSLYLDLLDGKPLLSRLEAASFLMNDNQAYPIFDEIGLGKEVTLNPFGEVTEYVFLSGLGFPRVDIRGFISRYRESSLNEYTEMARIRITSDYSRLDKLVNDCLPYQTVSSRIRARASFYQAGGGYGFRDQLQDMYAMSFLDADYVRGFILYCAERQYEEGDVMHWWHPPRFGVRTGISDDRLYLAYLTADYISKTGDLAILLEEVPYLTSQPIRIGEGARLETPPVTKYTESLLEHIRKAIFSCLAYGVHDLLLMGAGDWNDGLDRVGVEGRGESVLLSMQCLEILKKCQCLFDDNTAILFSKHIQRLTRGIENSFDAKSGVFKRAYTDSGEWLGGGDSPYVEVELTTQAYAVLCGLENRAMVERGLESAEKLIDRKNGLVKLADKPYPKWADVGYISSYPEGVRENGGQYTHAVVWYIKALLQIGKRDLAFEIINLINPLEKCKTREGTMRYKGEPYVLSADVYSHSDYEGRMGWSWYTGSAGLLYATLIEDFFGIKIRGKTLYFEPRLPKGFGNVRIELSYNGILEILYVEGEKEEVSLNGVVLANIGIPLDDDGKDKEIKVVYKGE